MHLLEQAAVFLLTAVVLVPLFRRARLGAVVGYLAAGMLIGPSGLALIADPAATLQFAEFGVVLLLFIIGLELEPRRLWVMRRHVFGLGAAQVAASALALGAAAFWLGLDWRAATVAGLGLALSSTALVLTALAERGQLGVVEQAQISGDRWRYRSLRLLWWGQSLLLIPCFAVYTIVGRWQSAEAENCYAISASCAYSIIAFANALQSRIDLLHGLQRSVIHAFQQTRGLLFLGMLFEFAFAFFGDRV